jgi:hypothetical protein
MLSERRLRHMTLSSSSFSMGSRLRGNDVRAADFSP